MKKKLFTYKNLLLFDELLDDDDIFDHVEDDKDFAQYKKTFGKLQKMLKTDGGETRQFMIPVPKPADFHWIQPGEKVALGNHEITAGHFYFGTNMPSGVDDSRNFPSLINPDISIPKKNKLDPKQNTPPYFIDYAELNGIQRREYILWHTGGRTDENIDDWFAILFLYGLERRVFIDKLRGLVKHGELMLIRDEVRRILTLYGGKSMRIRLAYSNFLAFLEIECADQRLYDHPAPYFECRRYKENDVFIAYLSTALAQCSDHRAPLPSDLAYYWYIVSSIILKSEIASKCGDEFRELFMIRYAETYGRGITVRKGSRVVPPTAEFYYYPECNGLYKDITRRRYRKAVIPEQGVILEKLWGLGLRCKNELVLYARRQAKPEHAAGAMLALPPVLWKGGEAEALQALKKELDGKRYLTTLDELKQAFFKNIPFSKSCLIDLAHALETEGIAMEPDIISFPDQTSDIIVLHILKNKIPKNRSSADYAFLKTIMELAASAYKLCAPQQQTVSWSYPIKLGAYFYERLNAYIDILMRYPPPLQQCIRRLRHKPESYKKSIIKYIREEILEGINTSYEAVSVIEKLYKGFGFSEKELYGDLHSGGVSAPDAKNRNVSLDHDKIERLREDSDHVYSMLSDIFTDEEAAENAAAESSVSKTDSKQEGGGCFNFSEAEANFLKTILSRAEWPRDELTEQARQQGFLLDGFIEIVNETAYDEFGEALIEGGETITINTDIAEMVTEKL